MCDKSDVAPPLPPGRRADLRRAQKAACPFLGQARPPGSHCSGRQGGRGRQAKACANHALTRPTWRREISLKSYYISMTIPLGSMQGSSPPPARRPPPPCVLGAALAFLALRADPISCGVCARIFGPKSEWVRDDAPMRWTPLFSNIGGNAFLGPMRVHRRKNEGKGLRLGEFFLLAGRLRRGVG